ncbi:hypothetical protein HDF26_002850 [Pedobacter cryoconitis]|uniref:hypothetical protein n=1 Tax=Pedobacter cryoconitis TaxID=188932 RepID=UPI00161B63CD|nr:hypothetical protein [Pedobacter cryoconitis]MBB6272393.1 hypothetical protein [Pedobacter cryoconitis]
MKNSTMYKAYQSYIKSVNGSMKGVPEASKYEMVAELQSHIYESLKSQKESGQTVDVHKVLDNLGAQEIISGNKYRARRDKSVLDQIKSSFKKLLLTCLYLVLTLAAVVLILKILYPANTGLFFKNDRLFGLGYFKYKNSNLREVLGYSILIYGFLFNLIVGYLIYYIKKERYQSHVVYNKLITDIIKKS